MSARSAISSAIFRRAGPSGTASTAMRVRRFWKGDKGLVAEMASRLAGSSDIFGYRGRRPWASINFITAHDGFTLQDLVSYEQKHNEANGEDNRDGHDANFSWNGGVEGPTDDPADRRVARPAEAQFHGDAAAVAGRADAAGRRRVRATRSAATTTPIARTTRSPGSTGRTSGPRTRRCAISCAT